VNTRHWLLELELDGRVYRWSVERQEVEDASGQTWVYRAGLEDLETAEGDEPTVSVVDESVDWPALGPEVDGRPAVLRRWEEGTALEEAQVVARGVAVSVRYGARYESIGLTIAEVVGLESLGVSFPDAAAMVTVEAWSAPGLGDEGWVYPVIFGYPGWDGATSNAVVPVPLGRTGALVTTDRIVVCEDGEQDITEVLIANATTNTEAAETVIRIVDLLGRPIRVAHFGADATPRPADEDTRDELFAGYYPDGGGGPRSAYEAFTYALRRWGPSSVDWGRLPEVRDLLGAYQVDTWVDQPQSDPWAWMESTFLGDLPVSVRMAARGRYLVPRRFRADPARVVGVLEAGRDGERSSGVEVDSASLVNEFSGLYRRSRDGAWLGQLVLTGQAGRVLGAPGVTAPVIVRAYRPCLSSGARYGLRQDPDGPLECDWTWDEGTLLRLLQDRADEFALPASFVEYELEGDTRFREGDDLLLVDEEMGWDELPAIVDEPPVVGGGRSTVRLRIPPRV
jgi:hypothetical protein